MLFLVCCDRAPWMCQYFTSSNQLLCKSEMAECIDIHDMLRDVFSEASRIETHNCHIPSLTLTRCACMTKQLMAQETCAGTRRLGVCASPIEATFPPEERLCSGSPFVSDGNPHPLVRPVQLLGLPGVVQRPGPQHKVNGYGTLGRGHASLSAWYNTTRGME